MLVCLKVSGLIHALSAVNCSTKAKEYNGFPRSVVRDVTVSLSICLSVLLSIHGEYEQFLSHCAPVCCRISIMHALLHAIAGMSETSQVTVS